MNSCERIKCPFYKNREDGSECGDKEEFVSKIDGNLICRFNKDAVEKYDINLIRQSAIAVIDAWISREPMSEPMRRLSTAIKFSGELGPGHEIY
jgi:hypothetical protein